MKVVIADDEPLARERLRDAAGRAARRRAGGRGATTAARPCTPAPSIGPTWCCWTSPCPASTAWKPRAISPRSNRARRWCSAPPTTRMRCRRSKRRRSTTWSSRCAPNAWPPRWSARAPSPPAANATATRRCRGASRRTHLCARLRGSLRLIPIEDVHYLQAEEKYVVVHHARGEDLIEESLQSLEEEFGERFVRIHRNCLVARHEIIELQARARRPRAGGAAPRQAAAGSQPPLRGAVAGDGEAPVIECLRKRVAANYVGDFQRASARESGRQANNIHGIGPQLRRLNPAMTAPHRHPQEPARPLADRARRRAACAPRIPGSRSRWCR